ncbi:hypothetical protein GCWU000342_00554 [Shuttleworthella satelles DSM 14600]|uniref:Uncharacterized protein n=1 Tax=Shuttleworthella satelles DSM 14600 TaxID=626523 RepID=C4G9A3_9FIRM|nr:hypothetical protein GCWU000342_00554 [Shuttleworthia satelles DSM 14600]
MSSLQTVSISPKNLLILFDITFNTFHNNLHNTSFSLISYVDYNI